MTNLCGDGLEEKLSGRSRVKMRKESVNTGLSPPGESLRKEKEGGVGVNICVELGAKRRAKGQRTWQKSINSGTVSKG